jgi:hypothetical protein
MFCVTRPRNFPEVWVSDSAWAFRESFRKKIVRMFHPGQQVRVNLAGMQVGSVLFPALVSDAVGTIVRQASEDPPKYLVKLLFTFRGVDEVEVPEGRIVAK